MVTPGSQQDFVVTTAQIIPVLILALVADPVARKKKRGNSSIMLLVALTAGVIGEAVALVSIYVGGEDWGIQVIGICLTVLAFAILRPHALVYWTRLVARYRLSSTRQALAQVLLLPYLGYMTWYNAVNDTQYHARAWFFGSLFAIIVVGVFIEWGRSRAKELRAEATAPAKKRSDESEASQSEINPGEQLVTA